MHALLTADKRIVMGMERYGGYLNDEFGPQLFSKERFFDFESDPRDWKKSRPYYEEVAEPCFLKAQYIGDKIPLLYLQFDRVTQAFPESKFIVLLRNIVDICNSYQNRKDDPNDNWSFDVDDAVSHWNQLLEFIKLHAPDPRIKLVIYEDFYTAGIQQYKDLYSFIDLDFDEMLRQEYLNILEKTQRLEQRRKTALSDVQKLSIFKKANFDLYQSILNQEIGVSSAATKEVKPIAKGRDPMSLDETDLRSAFRIFMGRLDVSNKDLDEFSSLNGSQVMAKIFATTEFQDNAFNRELITSLAQQIRDQLTKAKP